MLAKFIVRKAKDSDDGVDEANELLQMLNMLFGKDSERSNIIDRFFNEYMEDTTSKISLKVGKSDKGYSLTMETISDVLDDIIKFAHKKAAEDEVNEDEYIKIGYTVCSVMAIFAEIEDIIKENDN